MARRFQKNGGPSISVSCLLWHFVQTLRDLKTIISVRRLPPTSILVQNNDLTTATANFEQKTSSHGGSRIRQHKGVSPTLKQRHLKGRSFNPIINIDSRFLDVP